MTDETAKRDYKDTVFLPKTAFPMKAGLPQKEPGILARWQAADQYEQLRKARAGREKFILHDGPPYANGDMHIGHALNHVLKDTVVRTQTLLGKDAPYVPGWDCHGLPIEWKVEELYRKKKRNKNEVEPKEFRAECRAYAQKWVDVQREQLKRLGIGGRWDKPYLTMRPEAEGQIVAELMKFAESGQLYRGSKPVMWSAVEETALAEAEVEYEDIVSTQIDVAFEIVDAPNCRTIEKSRELGHEVHAIVWTTTPWTIPVNQALAFGPEIEYALIQEEERIDAEDDIWVENRRYIVATSLVASLNTRMRENDHQNLLRFKVLETFEGRQLADTLAVHPMHKLGGFYAKPRPMLAGDFVTTDSGTGLVHMSPDHGEDDFDLCKANGIDPVFAVMRDGRYRDDWLWLGAGDVDGEGKARRRSVINKPFNSSEGPICSDLREAGALLSASDDYAHSYPHSWRSKAKLIYRCTPQWFIGMDEQLSSDATLRETAMKAISDTRFIPEKGRNRLTSMVEGRPDWLISRQRAWGVPIALFVHRETGQLLVDTEVNARIVAAVATEGVDAWDEARAYFYLNGYEAGDDPAAMEGVMLQEKFPRDPDDYEMIADILDVWFDSGCTHAFVLESDEWPELQSPADLYLEGSDQHRGWFQSSLLESCGTRGRAPYDAVLTHGFTMDPKGMKMSKSLGNTVDPLKVMEQYGADIIRLWALSVDYTEDHRIGDEILKGVGDQYRKLRNTFRYMLGALEGFSDDEPLPESAMPELERYVLMLLGELDAKLKRAIDDFDFNTYVRALTEFAAEDLSAFYFDIRKDGLYCDAPESMKRRANRSVINIIFHALVRYAAPVLVFTSEEVWHSRFPDAGSVHFLEWPEVPTVETDPARWANLRALREKVTEAIEPLRREKIIRSGLEAEVVVPESAVPEGFSDADLAELFITASVTRGQVDAVSIARTSYSKCGRCWRLLPEVPEDGALCGRCDSVVSALDAA